MRRRSHLRFLVLRLLVFRLLVLRHDIDIDYHYDDDGQRHGESADGVEGVLERSKHGVCPESGELDEQLEAKQA